jgi:hypothetical protein
LSRVSDSGFSRALLSQLSCVALWSPLLDTVREEDLIIEAKMVVTGGNQSGKGAKGLLMGKSTDAAKDKKKPTSRSSRAGLQACYYSLSFVFASLAFCCPSLPHLDCNTLQNQVCCILPSGTCSSPLIHSLNRTYTIYPLLFLFLFPPSCHDNAMPFRRMSKSFLANVFPLHLHAYNLSSIFPVSSMS